MSKVMQGKPLPYAFFRGQIVPVDTACVSIMTNALQYGTGVFGGIRAYIDASSSSRSPKLNIFRIHDHYDRILKSVRILGQTLPFTADDLVRITVDLVKKNRPVSDTYIRPFAYASQLGISPDLQHATFDLAIYCIPLGEYLPVHAGLRLIVSSWTRISDRAIPARAKVTGGYINSALAKMEAGRLGCDDCLMLSDDGHVSEASAANFFMVRDGVLITSPKHSDILEGITRKSILTVAHEMGIPAQERDIDRTEVYIADEAFLCGTGVQVSWVAEVDHRKIGTGKMGPVTGKIQKAFFDIVRGRDKRYREWLTAV